MSANTHEFVSALRNQEHFLFKRSGNSALLAFGADQILSCQEPQGGFKALKTFLQGLSEPVYGHLSYEMKDDIEQLQSNNTDRIGFPALSFFKATNLLKKEAHQDWQLVKGAMPSTSQSEAPKETALPSFHPNWNSEEYTEVFAAVRNHIQRGNVYELNLCMEFIAEAQIDPFTLFAHLDREIEAPHAAFYRHGDHYAICMSPERSLLVVGKEVETKPMKGTRNRGNTKQADEALVNELLNDVKERAENIMAVDVSRNDLSRVAMPSSVVVDELCAVKTYPNVHQMISTVRCRLASDKDNVDLLRASFPMASMTGAPKISAMQLIEELEEMKRGIYSGCIGSLSLHGHLDMNVVIRTIEYNAKSQTISLKSGGAVTALSQANAEYEEVLVKVNSVLSNAADAR